MYKVHKVTNKAAPLSDGKHQSNMFKFTCGLQV